MTEQCSGRYWVRQGNEKWQRHAEPLYGAIPEVTPWYNVLGLASGWRIQAARHFSTLLQYLL